MTWLDNVGIRGQCGNSMVFQIVAVLVIILATVFFPGTGFLFMIPVLAASAVLRGTARNGNSVPCAPVCQARPQPVQRKAISFSRWASDIEARPFRASFRSQWLGDVIGDID